MRSDYIDGVTYDGTTYDIVSSRASDNVAEEYSDQGTYAVGDCVIHEGRLYECRSAVSGESWSASKWRETNIDSALDAIRATLDGLTYEPMSISTMNVSPSVLEVGATVQSVTVTYGLNKIPATLTFDGTGITPGQTGTYTKTGLSITTDKTWTLTATDAGSATMSPTTDTKSASTVFRHKIHYGKAALGTVNRAFLYNSLQNHPFAANRKTSFNVTPGSSEYIWFACPTDFGNPTFVTGGAFEGGFRLAATITFKNDANHDETYQVWRSDEYGLGYTEVEVK